MKHDLIGSRHGIHTEAIHDDEFGCGWGDGGAGGGSQ